MYEKKLKNTNIYTVKVENIKGLCVFYMLYACGLH